MTRTHRLFRRYCRMLQRQIAVERFNRSQIGMLVNSLKRVYATMIVVNPVHFVALHTILARSKAKCRVVKRGEGVHPG